MPITCLLAMLYEGRRSSALDCGSIAEGQSNMQTTANPKAGQILGTSTIAFTACFAVWTIFSIIGIRIRQELSLTETQFGLLVGTPILTGSLIRVALGIWTDRYGGRLVFAVTMLTAAIATFLLAYAHTYLQMLVAALGVGIAGGSFAVGVAYVSRWYPRKGREQRLAFSEPAMSVPQSRNSSRPSCSSLSVGKSSHRSGRRGSP